MHAAQRVQDVMSSHFRFVRRAEPMSKYDGVSIVLADERGSGDSLTGSAPPGEALGAACGPVLIDHAAVFGRALPAAEYATASGAAARALCVAGEWDDLHEAARQMNLLGADVLLVSRSGSTGFAPRSSDVVGVVTKADITENFASKSQLMARDRTLTRDDRRSSLSAAGGTSVRATHSMLSGLG